MKKSNLVFTLLTLSALLPAAAPPGVPRDSNTNNTGGYDGTRVEAQLLVPLKEGADSIHLSATTTIPGSLPSVTTSKMWMPTTSATFCG